MQEEKSIIGKINPREITNEMKESYIDYAMSVIVSRALPDVRDGLKPVQRRILYAMYEMGVRSDAKFRKSAAVTGEVLGKFHPHGDAAVYGALVRMAQDFSLRYPLVHGQGNFGSIDGDPPAAQRYTECKLSKVGERLLKDIEKNTVDFIDNYDSTKQEPTVLPSPFPNLLLNGSMGIAVGMATNIPPHNIKEVCEAAIHLIDNPQAEVEDLYEFIKGPDFPTGGIIFDKKEIISAYSQGKGTILTRGNVEIVERQKGGYQLVIDQIPYQVDKSMFITQLANLVSTKRVDGIKDIRDESDKDGMRIVITLQKGVIPKKILNSLYKFSDLQKTFHLNMLALVNGIEPRVLNLKEVLEYYLLHREDVIVRRTTFDLEKAKARAHILEGILKALDNIDAVIDTIRKSKDKEDARNNLVKKFKLTIIQAEAILEIRLHQLAKMEKAKVEDELKLKLKEIKELSAILGSEKKVKEVVKKELREQVEEFGGSRKTKVVASKPEEISEEDLVPLEDTIIALTQDGYIKRMDPAIYKKQKRGGTGILGMKTAQEDVICHFLVTKTHDSLYFFTDSGKVFRTKAYEVPEGTRVARGRGLVNFLEISAQDNILSILPISKEDKDADYLVMATKNGIIKKTPLKDFENVRRTGLIAINLKKGDALCSVKKVSKEDNIMLVTKRGQSIRFSESNVRAMGRSASGVKGIKLKKQDEVIGMEIIVKGEEKTHIMILTENGYGKLTNVSEYRKQTRGGSGIKTAKITDKTGEIAKTDIITEQKDLIVISKKGQIIRTKIESIAKLKRDTQGVKIMKLRTSDKVASATCL